MAKTIIELNDDMQYVAMINEKLKENDGYCPCSLIKDVSTKCMCEEFRNQEEGWCHCMKFNKRKVDVE